MKNPDEIKKGLECCQFDSEGCRNCDECPYNQQGQSCSHKNADALAYIQRLELDKTRLLEESHELRKDMVGKIRQLERERDAAVDDMTTVIYNGLEMVCQFCKHRDAHKCAQICGFAFKGFEWRGVKEE